MHLSLVASRRLLASAICSIVVGISCVAYYALHLKSNYGETMITCDKNVHSGSLRIGSRTVALPASQPTYFFSLGTQEYHVIVGNTEEKGTIQMQREMYLFVDPSSPMLQGSDSIRIRKRRTRFQERMQQ